MDAFHARDPYVPSEQIKNSMPAPLVRLMDDGPIVFGI
jgi:hypothetical protein